MKFAPLLGVAVALVLAAAPSQAETISTVADISSESAAALPAPLVIGFVLITLALLAVKMARRKLSRLNWDSLD